MADIDNRAALLAIEVLLWQLVTTGVLRAAPLAAELERYAGLLGDADVLRTFANMVRAAALPSLAV